jgi:hypothetical protein
MFIIDDFLNGIAGSNAAKAEKKQIENAMTLQKGVHEQNNNLWNPYYQLGLSSTGQLKSLASGKYGADQLQMDPGYQFRMQQGQQALERSAAARGGLKGGAFAKGLDRYSQGLASDEFGRAYDRRYNSLMGLAGIGQNAAGAMSGLNERYANNMSSLYGAMGNADAAKMMANMGAGINAGKSAINMGMMASGGMGGGMGSGGAGYSGDGSFGGGINPSNYGFQYGGAPAMSYGYGSGAGPSGYSLGNYNIAPPQTGGGYGYGGGGWIPPQQGGGY